MAIGNAVIIDATTGEETPVPMGIATMVCPHCGQPREAINQVTVRNGDNVIYGFADTDEQLRDLAETLSEWAERPPASIDEVLAMLRADGVPVKNWFARWVDQHRKELTSPALIVALLGILLAGAQYVKEDEPPVPGITEQQFKRLLRDLKRDYSNFERPERRGKGSADDSQDKGSHRQPPPASHAEPSAQPSDNGGTGHKP